MRLIYSRVLVSDAEPIEDTIGLFLWWVFFLLLFFFFLSDTDAGWTLRREVVAEATGHLF